MANGLIPRRGRQWAALFLLLVQAVCGLYLPALLGETATVGLRQDGLAAVCPEAVSQRGLALLRLFMTQEEQEMADGLYNTFEPGSSEAQRLSGDYPLLRERPVCVLRERLTQEERQAADSLYAQASHAFLLYLQSAVESGVLDETAQEFADAQKRKENRDPGEFGENIRLPQDGDTESYPEGVLGSIPEGALFTLPEDAPPAQEDPSSQPEEPDTAGMSLTEGGGSSQTGESAEGDPEGSSGDVAESGRNPFPTDAVSLSQTDAEQLYELAPLAAQAHPDGWEAARAASQAASAVERDRTAAILSGVFLRELGVDTGSVQRDYLWGAARKILCCLLVCVLAGVGALWLGVPLFPEAALCAAAGIGGLVLAVVNGPSAAWSTAGALGLVIVWIAACFLSGRLSKGRRGAGKIRGLLRFAPAFPAGWSLAIALAGGLALWAGSGVIRSCTRPAGKLTALFLFVLTAAGYGLFSIILIRFAKGSGPSRQLRRGENKPSLEGREEELRENLFDD